ncbi:uncharacterized protein LOC122860059 isoform X2 [Aphidius gifuensis]|uniref:uncharacterized protein LOC122860059 isoform X2 n=1 Tax=Aphidius gifuensis TaxID=684658 RepID=UPI001CDC812B|nr:uncharacterized protein LOC122860059 isoform X2 [Aphidius gifuensis]
MAENNVRFHDGVKFICKSSNKNINVRYFNCCYEKCKARGKESDTMPFTLIRNTHNHSLKNGNDALIHQFKKKLHTKVQLTMDKTRKVYNEIANEHPTAASQIPFVRVDRSMRRWRAKVCPKRPKSLEEYGAVLNSDEWKHLLQYEGGQLTSKSTEFTDAEGKTFTIINMANVDLLSTIQSNEFCVDATYNVCPKYLGKLQFLTIMALIDDTFEPIFWALMPRKTEEAYKLVFQQFLTWTQHMEHQMFHTDYEQAISNAIQSIFNNATIIYCYFHYLYNLLKNLKKIIGPNKMKALLSWNQGKIFYRKLMALPLFPPNDIVRVLDWIVAHATPNQTIFFSTFIAYIRNTWINNIGVHKFSVYRITRRTNNPIESYHRHLREKLGSHPLIWEFTSGLVKLVAITHSELTALNSSLAVRRPPERRYRDQENVLSRAWQLYEEHILDIPKFLSCANHFLRGLGNKYMIIKDIPSVDYFSYAPKHNIDILPPVEQVHVIEIGPDVGWLPIIPHTYSDNREVLLFDNLADSLCRMCYQEIADYITVPCHHWYSCLNCIEKIRVLCERNNTPLRCSCTNTIIAFTRVQVS